MSEDTNVQNQPPVQDAGAAPVRPESAQTAFGAGNDASGFRPEGTAGQAAFQPEGAQANPGSQAFSGAAGPQQHAQAAPVPPFAPDQGIPAQQPGYAPAPVQPPVPQLTGGMKFGYFALGFLGNLLGILIAWLINADKHPAIRNSSIKWSVVGFAATFVLGILIVVALFGMLGALFAAIGAGAYAYDPSSYYYTF